MTAVQCRTRNKQGCEEVLGFDDTRVLDLFRTASLSVCGTCRRWSCGLQFDEGCSPCGHVYQFAVEDVGEEFLQVLENGGEPGPSVHERRENGTRVRVETLRIRGPVVGISLPL